MKEGEERVNLRRKIIFIPRLFEWDENILISAGAWKSFFMEILQMWGCEGAVVGLSHSEWRIVDWNKI